MRFPVFSKIVIAERTNRIIRRQVRLVMVSLRIKLTISTSIVIDLQGAWDYKAFYK
jgi:hypothetical protein